VVIITALSDELHALLALGEGGQEGWRKAQDLSGFPYFWREITGPSGAPLRIAAATAAEMTEVPVATRAVTLIQELKPDGLAMCGICAGKRGDVALGDVIVADRAYFHDHGKEEAPREGGGQVTLSRDIKTYNLDKAWKAEVELFAKGRAWGEALEELLTMRPLAKRAQRQWLLEVLYAHACEEGIAPQQHPDRKARCPAWGKAFLDELAKEGLLVVETGKVQLTSRGREEALNERLYSPEGPPEEPRFQIHTAPMASGSAVKQDPALFAGLKPFERKTLGVEMEAAALAHVAEEHGLRWMVAKAVSDFGDHDKDDAFRTFAASASAAFLLAFFAKHLRPSRRELGRSERAARGREMADFSQGRGAFVERVERVYRAKDPYAELVRVRSKAPLAGILEQTRKRAGQVHEEPIGIVEGEASEEAVRAFAEVLNVGYRRENPYLQASLIHIGPHAPEALRKQARKEYGVLLKSFAALQGLIDFSPYLAWQTGRLEASGRYPSALYVEQHAKVSATGQEPASTSDALSTLVELLDDDQPRFVLILGDFGAGKTFLLHELARRMARDKLPPTPVLVELRALEKAHALDPLLAQHLARADVAEIKPPAFRYMLREGRVALLFDGFDELALRVSYDRALEHFATLAQAAEGNAKVVVTSRTQHFLTDTEVKKELAKRAEMLPGYRLIKLLPFDKGQIRRFLVKRLEDEQAAEERFRLLDQVKDLLGLSENPRMLSFIAEIPAEDLKAAEKRKGKITSAALYALLIDRWLADEHARANPEGAPDGLSRKQLWAGAVELAKVLSASVNRSVRLREAAVLSVAFDPAGTTLASGSSDTTVRLWNVNTGGKLRFVEGHTNAVHSVAFDPEGKSLASGSSDTTVLLWDVTTGHELRSFKGHTGAVTSIAFSPDGKTLASASQDGTLRLWHVAIGDCLAILYPTPEGWVAFTPEGRYKLGGSFWHVIGLCRFEPGELDPYLPRPLRIPDDEPLFTPR
jgi:nucleoside phosphorylase